MERHFLFMPCPGFRSPFAVSPDTDAPPYVTTSRQQCVAPLQELLLRPGRYIASKDTSENAARQAYKLDTSDLPES